MKRAISILLSVILLLSAIPFSVNAETKSSIPADAVTFNGHKYFVFPNDTVSTWEAAKIYCENLGGYLAVISSSEENQFLNNYIHSLDIQSAYFGYTDSEKEGTWKWIENEESTYSNWHWGEPNGENSNEDYAEFYWKWTDGTWNDGNFKHGTDSDGNAFICEWGCIEHQWYFDKQETALKCSNCKEIIYLSSNKNFKFNKDNFSFHHKDIGSNDISETGLKYLNPILKYDIAALGFNKLSHGVNYIINKIDNTGYGTWRGSCYGISCMDASFLSNLDTSLYGGDSVYELLLNTKLKDSINIMMYSQASILSYGNKAGKIFSNKNKDAVSAAKNISSNSYLPVLCYNGPSGGHAVNIIGILPDDYDPNYYILTVYDCNSVDKPNFIIVSKDYKKAYLGGFYFDNSLTPINVTSDEIEINVVITGEQNSIDFWAPGLSMSTSYTSVKKKAMKQSKSLESNVSNDTNHQTISNENIQFLLASDGDLEIIAEDGSSFTYNNGIISNSNIEDLYYEELTDFGVTKVIIPHTTNSFNIKSNEQYYANVSFNDKKIVYYCEKGGFASFSCDGVASVDTRITKSYYELSCYSNDIISNSDIFCLLTNNSDSEVVIDFSNENPIINSSNLSDIDIKVQNNDSKLSIIDIENTLTNNDEEIILKLENEKIIIQQNETTIQNLCKFCGKEHGESFWEKLVSFFHNIFYFFNNLTK